MGTYCCIKRGCQIKKRENVKTKLMFYQYWTKMDQIQIGWAIRHCASATSTKQIYKPPTWVMVYRFDWGIGAFFWMLTETLSIFMPQFWRALYRGNCLKLYQIYIYAEAKQPIIIIYTSIFGCYTYNNNINIESVECGTIANKDYMFVLANTWK